MRIYGASPLYNYVELLFRCKRLFILSIILGTLVTSLMVYMRRAQYEATMIIGLSGDPMLAAELGGTQARSAVIMDAQRKARNLLLWVEKQPDFLETALKDVVINNVPADRRYGAEYPEFVSNVRKKLRIGKELINGQYMEVSLVWHNPEEAEKILNAIYGRYSSRTVDQETITQAQKVKTLEEQFQRYDKEANEKARLRTAYLRDKYWQNPAALGQRMGQSEQIRNRIVEVKLDIADAQVRLEQVRARLQVTPQYITGSTEEVINVQDPTLALVQKRQEMETQLQQMKLRYADSHPTIRDMMQQIEAITQQIEAERKKPRELQTSQTRSARMLNSEWQSLREQQTALELTIGASRRRLNELESQFQRTETFLRQMPEEEATWRKIDQEYVIADNIRNNMRAQLKAAQIEEERDRQTNATLMEQTVPPRSERLDNNRRVAMLYALGPILGIIIAFCFSLVAESLDHTLRTPVEVEKHLGKPVLAVLPKVKAPREGRKELSGGGSRPGITS
jgi:uncharacterized protein involved in exopolysaccharide biosynthesis